MKDELHVPWLRSGIGTTPSDGGCIMQVLDWIDRNGWSDVPECVHPVIRELAIWVNDDDVPDDERQRLLDLAPRMMGTNTGDEVLTRKLVGWLARQVYPIYEQWAQEASYDDHGSVLACIEAAERGEAAGAAWAMEAMEATEVAWATGATGAAWAAEVAEVAWAARAAWAAWAAWAFDLLVGLLDRYDELTGRTEIVPMDFAEVCKVMAS